MELVPFQDITTHKFMTEIKESSIQNDLSQEEIFLQGSYVLVYLKNQLREVRNKKPIRGLSLSTAFQLFDPAFKEVNLDARFNLGSASFVAEKHEYHDYLEIGFTKFPDEDTSDIVSEGFRIRVKRGDLSSANFIEYHKNLIDDKNSEKQTNTKMSVSKAMDFISVLPHE